MYGQTVVSRLVGSSVTLGVYRPRHSPTKQATLWRGAAFHVPSLFHSSSPSLCSIRVLGAGSSSNRAAGCALGGICWRQLSLLPLFPHGICHSLAGPGRLCREADSLERILGLFA